MFYNTGGNNNSFHELNLSTFLDETVGNNQRIPTVTNSNENLIYLQNINYRKYFELSPMLPFGMMLIVSTIIFILVIFRRWPGLVAGVIAGCLTSVSIYFLLTSFKEQKRVYQ